MTFEKFKQQIDDLEERRKIVKQVEEEKLNGYISTVAKGVTSVFTTLGPYIGYSTEACGLTNKEKCIAYTIPFGYMKIRWMDKWLSSKIEINIEVRGAPRIDIKTTCDDLRLGRVKNLDQLQILHSIFKEDVREKLVDGLAKDLYNKIEKDELYVRS